ncbi:MAG TPA: AIR synthase-related protein, partial [Acidimicrobiales bacterium]
NPEHPEVMWQLSEAIDGMTDGCLAMGLPVIGGNVSLYNESRGVDIDPTPVIGLLGLVDSLERRPPGTTLVEGHRLVLLGDDLGSPAPSLAGSTAAWGSGQKGGVLPELDWPTHTRVANFVRDRVSAGGLSGVHDVSTGGLATALGEMAVRSGVGVDVAGVPTAAHALGEGPSRVVAAVAPDDVDGLLADARGAGLAAVELGTAGGDRFVIRTGGDSPLVDLSLTEVVDAWRNRLPTALGEGVTQG